MKNISRITSYFIIKYNNSKKNKKKSENKIEYKQETKYKQETEYKKETKEASCQCDLMFLSYGVSTGF